MPFTDVAPPAAPPPPGTGYSFGLQVSKRARTARLTIRADKQMQVFGKSIIGERVSVQAGRGSDEGRLRIVLDPNGDIEVKGGIKASASIKMNAWDLLPKDKRPAGACEVHSQPSNVELILTLPKWCRPSGVGGKMEAEFGLKKPAQRSA